AAANPDDASFLQHFFKTGPGEYGAGDRFLGIRVPVLRRIARAHTGVPLRVMLQLLRSPYHEARLTALLLLVRAYQRADAREREIIFQAYLRNTRYVNNWDLVDLSAADLVGRHCLHGDRSTLRRLAASESLWERRIAVIATFHFIKHDDFGETLRIARILLRDPHDLIHKAAGWMLREVGKRDRAIEEAFLKRYYSRMPRTMLRYAIERLPEPRRQQYLRGEV
ncbi:MAG TPA: DNA alkylation repair protein, partial [Longimicrobiales bacterium]|nr:DNA alkylation repair protein [Longimicrobiales bacterium]